MSKEQRPSDDYKLAEIYASKDKEGNLILFPNWYVYFFVRDPLSGDMVMRKRTQGMNRIKSIKQRLAEARDIQKNINKMLLSGWNPLGVADRKQYFLTDIITQYLETHVKKLKERSYHTVKSGMNRLTEYYTEKKQRPSITEVTKEDIIASLNRAYKLNHWSNSQWNNSLSRFRTFFNWVIANTELIEKNPCNKIVNLKAYPTDDNRPATEEEWKRIVNYLYKNDRQLFLFEMTIYYQGFRVTETGRIRRDMIEFDAENPYFRLAAEMQKDNEVIVQYISPNLLLYYYQAGIDKLPMDHYLFSTHLNPGPKPVKKVKEIAEERWREQIKIGLNIPVNLYSAKHKQATELAESTSIKQISNFLRHSSEEVTRQYMKKYKPVVKIEFYQAQRPLPIEE